MIRIECRHQRINGEAEAEAAAFDFDIWLAGMLTVKEWSLIEEQTGRNENLKPMQNTKLQAGRKRHAR